MCSIKFVTITSRSDQWNWDVIDWNIIMHIDVSVSDEIKSESEVFTSDSISSWKSGCYIGTVVPNYSKTNIQLHEGIYMEVFCDVKHSKYGMIRIIIHFICHKNQKLFSFFF